MGAAASLPQFVGEAPPDPGSKDPSTTKSLAAQPGGDSSPIKPGKPLSSSPSVEGDSSTSPGAQRLMRRGSSGVEGRHGFVPLPSEKSSFRRGKPEDSVTAFEPSAPSQPALGSPARSEASGQSAQSRQAPEAGSPKPRASPGDGRQEPSPGPKTSTASPVRPASMIVESQDLPKSQRGVRPNNAEGRQGFAEQQEPRSRAGRRSAQDDVDAVTAFEPSAPSVADLSPQADDDAPEPSAPCSAAAAARAKQNTWVVHELEV